MLGSQLFKWFHAWTYLWCTDSLQLLSVEQTSKKSLKISRKDFSRSIGLSGTTSSFIRPSFSLTSSFNSLLVGNWEFKLYSVKDSSMHSRNWEIRLLISLATTVFPPTLWVVLYLALWFSLSHLSGSALQPTEKPTSSFRLFHLTRITTCPLLLRNALQLWLISIIRLTVLRFIFSEDRNKNRGEYRVILIPPFFEHTRFYVL